MVRLNQSQFHAHMLWFDQWVHVNPRQHCRLSIRVFENLRRAMSNAHWEFLSRKSNCVLLIIKSVCKIRTSVPLLYWLCEMDSSPFGRGNSWSKMVTKYASLLWLTGEISSTNLVRYLWGMCVAITIERGSKEELFKSTSNWDPGWCLTSTVSTKIRND